MQSFFGEHIYTGGGEGKLTCILKFATVCGIHDLEKIAFVDDKPDNILPVAKGSKVYVIGFGGSGKYPQTRDFCLEKGIVFAGSVADLKRRLI